MILYVNGDSHTAAAEAVNPFAFAEDDPALKHLGRLPHPENLQVSWGRKLADTMKAAFKCDAESAASNTRIMRTTRRWLEENPTDKDQVFVIIQWSTWERQEWLIDGKYYQINASGVDDVPDSHQLAYKEYIAGIDWDAVTQQAHQSIWDFHQELSDSKVKHLFFNGNNHFGKISKKQRHNWGTHYIGPYDADLTYNQWLLSHGHDTVAPNSYHFGKNAHAAWGRFVLQYCMSNQLVT